MQIHVALTAEDFAHADAAGSAGRTAAFADHMKYLYESEMVGRKLTKAVFLSLGFELAAAFSVYGTWHVWQILK